MRNDDDDLIDDGETEGDEEIVEPDNTLDKNQRELEAQRKLERMRERKELLKELGDDWSDELLDEDL